MNAANGDDAAGWERRFVRVVNELGNEVMNGVYSER
jgi:hypothetical protein